VVQNVCTFHQHHEISFSMSVYHKHGMISKSMTELFSLWNFFRQTWYKENNNIILYYTITLIIRCNARHFFAITVNKIFLKITTKHFVHLTRQCAKYIRVKLQQMLGFHKLLRTFSRKVIHLFSANGFVGNNLRLLQVHLCFAYSSPSSEARV